MRRWIVSYFVSILDRYLNLIDRREEEIIVCVIMNDLFRIRMDIYYMCSSKAM